MWPTVPMCTDTLGDRRGCRFLFDETDAPSRAQLEKLFETAQERLAAETMQQVRPAAGSSGHTMVLCGDLGWRELSVLSYANEMQSALRAATTSMSFGERSFTSSEHWAPTLRLAKSETADRISFYDRLTTVLERGLMPSPYAYDALTGVKLFPDPRAPAAASSV